MINLLPPSQKRELFEEAIYKTTLILGMVVVAAIVSLGLMLVAINWLFSGQIEIKKIAFEQRERQLNIYNIAAEEKKMSDYRSGFMKLGDFYKKQVKVSQLFDNLVGAMPAGSNLDSFSFQEGAVSISGYCPDRAGLVAFQSNLESQKQFRNVYVPPGNWVMQKDIKFNITFDYEPKE